MVDLRAGIIAAARRLGMDPIDLATIIHYESGFNPEVWGGAGGKHYGLIQFGGPEREQYGVEIGNPASQLGEDGAIVKYMLGRGFKPGMGMLDAYSTINAGSPGRYKASDAANGGQPGDVEDKVLNQMKDDRLAAAKLIGNPEQFSLEGFGDPRRDTPSSARPQGSALPGPVYPDGTTDYSNPISPSRGPSGPGAGPGGVNPDAPGNENVPKVAPKPAESGWKTFGDKFGELMGEGVGLPTGGLPSTDGMEQPRAALAPTASGGIDPESIELRRRKLAEAMTKLNSGKLFL